MNICELERMSNMDFDEVDFNDLPDFDKRSINEDKSVEDRLIDFIREVGNPYFRKTVIADVNVVVKINFTNDGSVFGNNVQGMINKILH